MGVLIYGWGAANLGSLGASVGWPMFQTTIILASAAAAISVGEWRSVQKETFRLNIVGLMILIAAVVVLSFGSRM